MITNFPQNLWKFDEYIRSQTCKNMKIRKNAIKSSITCSHIWSIDTSKCVYQSGTQFAKVLLRYNTLDMNGRQLYVYGCHKNSENISYVIKPDVPAGYKRADKLINKFISCYVSLVLS